MRPEEEEHLEQQWSASSVRGTRYVGLQSDTLGVRIEKNCGLPVKEFAPCIADPLQCTAWSLHRFRANHRPVQIARMLAREIRTY